MADPIVEGLFYLESEIYPRDEYLQFELITSDLCEVELTTK